MFHFPSFIEIKHNELHTYCKVIVVQLPSSLYTVTNFFMMRTFRFTVLETSKYTIQYW